MPVNQSHESVVVADDDNAVFASPMTSLTHQLSGAGLTPSVSAGAAASSSAVKPALISDSVRFGIDDSNDSLLQFRRPTLQQQFSCEDDNEDDWVPARLPGYDDEENAATTDCNGTPIRSRTTAAAPAFCSSPSEPTLRRRLWSPMAAGNAARSGTGAPQQPANEPRLATVPLFGFSSSPTSMQRRRRPPRPPPATAARSQQQPRRRSFKRPSPVSQPEQPQQPLDQTPKTATPKRRRLGRTPLGDSTNSKAPSATSELQHQQHQQSKKPPLLQRCTSEMSALNSKRGSTLDSDKVDKAIASIDSLNLIGNSEQQHSLPTVKEMDYGIRYVTAATVSGLLRGEFADRVPNYQIIDCRYPYEFDGGHIQGAINIYKQEDLLSTIVEPAVAAAASGNAVESPRPVLIFHCEFSSERAPKLARFLRQTDRECNAENYPILHFPEVYLLKDGRTASLNFIAECPIRSFRNELAAFQRDRLDWQRRHSHKRHSRMQRLASCQQFH
uniref:M-phase inducer phosphatase n=1 Tax=Macrostomum lignano TaxID=282301 RepID=A0A1I8ISZ8_9PLAT